MRQLAMVLFFGLFLSVVPLFAGGESASALNQAFRDMESARVNYENLTRTQSVSREVLHIARDFYQRKVQEFNELKKRAAAVFSQTPPQQPPLATPKPASPPPASSELYPGLVVGKGAVVEVSSALNFRTEPWGAIQGTLTPGTPVTILGFHSTQREWVKISVNGRTGFVHGRYLKSGSGQNNPAPRPNPYENNPIPRGIAKNIVRVANAQLGTKRYQTAVTEYGNLACAAYVSGVLKEAGAIRGEGSLNTHGLRSILQKQGWYDVSLSQIQPGDVIFWGPIPGVTKHGHVGVIEGRYGGTWYSCDNSSSRKYPIKRPLDTKRQIVAVMRSANA